MMKEIKKSAGRTALIPGSFDPMTAGHVELVRRALCIFDRVIVAVMNNSEKDYMFSAAERVELARLSLGGLEGVEVVSSDGLTAELYAAVGASALVKGVRNRTDFSYELIQADFNSERPERCETLLLAASEKYRGISSTAVRRSLQKGRIPGKLLEPAAAARIGELLAGRRGDGREG